MSLKYLATNITFQEIPDEVSLVFSISNCPFECKGCHSGKLRQDVGDILNEEVLLRYIDKYLNKITCICFMGGDRTPSIINDLAKIVKSKGLKVAWYSGAEFIHSSINVVNFDFIKIGGYNADLGGLDSSQSNQKYYIVNGEELIYSNHLFWKK